MSQWPALTIWRDHQPDNDARGEGWDRRIERIALWRAGENVRFQLLAPADFAFRHALAHGQGLERAVERAQTQDPMFDLAGALVRLFGDGLVVAVAEAAPTQPIDGAFHDHDL